MADQSGKSYPLIQSFNRPFIMSSFDDPSHDEITQRAKSLWEERGRPEGRDTEIWLDAEKSLKQRDDQSFSSAQERDSTPPISVEKSSRRAQRREADDNRNRAPAPETRLPPRAPRSNGPLA